MNWDITQRIKLIVREISTGVRRTNLYTFSLALLAMDSGAYNFILVLPTYDCVVKLCNPYVIKPTVNVTPNMVFI
jgi:hypothetical protein